MTANISNYNRGTVELQKNKYAKALQFYKREQHEFKELYLNSGNAYRMLGDVKNAWAAYARANDVTVVDLDGEGGEYPDALGNMGLLAYQTGDDGLAGEFYTRALAVDPLHVMSVWNYSLALLRDYCSGAPLHHYAWKMHEYRFKAVKAVDVLPRWTGERVDRILVISEQGFGDKLMYGRYLSLLAQNCDELWVQCPVEMDCFFSSYKTCRTVEESGCSVGIPFGCLPEVFCMVPGTWIPRTVTNNRCFTVAVEWSGSATHKNDHNRSCFAGYFTRLSKAFPDIRFINVRPDSKPVKGVEKVPSNSWSDSTRLVSGCDLVISVDTSLVHLAGSLGVPTLLMQPLCDTDFRWGNPVTKATNGLDIESNIWYESVRVLENTGWEEMFEKLVPRIRAEQAEHFKRKLLGNLTPQEFIRAANAQNS